MGEVTHYYPLADLHEHGYIFLLQQLGGHVLHLTEHFLIGQPAACRTFNQI